MLEPMTNPSLNAAEIKDLMKTAILEILQENRDLVQDIITEALEDLALIHAIDEGKNSEPVSRDVIFSILESSE